MPKLKPKSVAPFLIPIFLTLFFLSLLSSKTKRAPWYEQWAFNMISPATSVLSWLSNAGEGFWNHYVYLVNTAKENEWLKQELTVLNQKLVNFGEALQENKRLNDLLELKQNVWPRPIAARVVAYDPRSEFKSLRINKGYKDGIKPDAPVIALNGLVGKIGPVFSDEAIVLLIVDPSSTVDVMIERSRVRSLLVGTAKNTELRPGYFLTRLEYLKRTSDLQGGDLVATSGLDQLFPRGISVGTVESIVNNRFGIFLEAEVVPMVDFSRLGEVLVLQRP